MTEYKGTKSLSAEILIDFEKRELVMDYSLNKFGGLMGTIDSNHSVAIDSEWRSLPIITRMKYASIVCTQTGVSMIPISFIMLIMSLTNGLGKISPSLQLYYQKLLKWWLVLLGGIDQQTSEGKLDTRILKFHLHHNTWISYELEGEYRDKITSISLVRNMVHHYKFGKFEEEKQRGWNMIFEFTEPPTSGSCTIKYV
jgi:hypothetical protein